MGQLNARLSQTGSISAATEPAPLTHEGYGPGMTIGERVAWYRTRRGLSQEVLAGLVGRTTDWLSKVENGRAALDRLSVITMLAEALDVSLGDLLGEPSLTHGRPQRRSGR
jgi:ribosome-binding protein aMBF1 (putative translation factor)